MAGAGVTATFCSTPGLLRVRLRALREGGRMRILSSVVVLWCGIALAQQQPQQSAVIAVKTGRLLDPVSQKVRTGAVVVIQDGRIKSVGDTVPAGAQVVD